MFDFSVKLKAVDSITPKIEKINRELASLLERTKLVSNSIGKRLNMVFGTVRKIKLNAEAAVSKVAGLATKIIGLGELRPRIRVNIAGAMSSIMRLRDRLSTVGFHGRRMQRLSRDMAWGVIPLSLGMMYPIKVARDREVQFAQVKRIVSGSLKQYEDLRKTFTGYRGMNFADMVTAGIDAGKMGLPIGKIGGFVETTGKATQAFDLDTTDTVDKLGKIIELTGNLNRVNQASKIIIDSVANAQNKLAGTKAKGIIDVLTRTITPLRNLGLSLKDMVGWSAFLDQISRSSRLGSRAFKMMMNEFKKSDEKLGYYSHIKNFGVKGLEDVLGQLGKLSEADLLRDYGVRGKKLISALLLKGSMAKLKMALRTANDSVGTMDAIWKKFRHTFDQKLKDTGKSFANLSEAIGRPMKKVMYSFLVWLDPILRGMTKWADAHKTLIKYLFMIIAPALAFIAVLAVLVGSVSLIMIALGGLGVVLRGVTALIMFIDIAMLVNPMTIWLIAILAVVAGFALLITYWGQISAWLSHLWDGVASYFEDTWSDIVKGFEGIWATLKGWWLGFWNWLIEPIREAVVLIDKLLSKFEWFRKLSGKYQGLKDAVADGLTYTINEGNNQMRNVREPMTIGPQDYNAGRGAITLNNNVHINRDGGISVDTTAKGNGVKLRTTKNGIGGR